MPFPVCIVVDVVVCCWQEVWGTQDLTVPLPPTSQQIPPLQPAVCTGDPPPSVVVASRVYCAFTVAIWILWISFAANIWSWHVQTGFIILELVYLVYGPFCSPVRSWCSCRSFHFYIRRLQTRCVSMWMSLRLHHMGRLVLLAYRLLWCHLRWSHMVHQYTAAWWCYHKWLAAMHLLWSSGNSLRSYLLLLL